MAADCFFVPSEDMKVEPERQKELIVNFYKSLLDIMSEFHGVSDQHHPDNQASDYQKRKSPDDEAEAVFDELVAFQIDDMLNGVAAGFASPVIADTDLIYKVAMDHFDNKA